MSSEPSPPVGTFKYVLSSIIFTCFRAFKNIQRLDLTSPKRNLMILASNCFGKSGIVDGLEYITSEDGTVERIGNEENIKRNKAGPIALKNAFRANEKNPSSVRAKIEAYDKSDSTKATKFLIERIVGAKPKSETKLQTSFLTAIKISPIMRGEEANSFVTEVSPNQRFERLAIWTRRKSLLGIVNQVRETAARSPIALSTIEGEIIAINAKLANATNQKITEWQEYAVCEYVNNELLNQIDPTLKMSNLTHSDPTYLQLQERVEALMSPSNRTRKKTNQKK